MSRVTLPALLMAATLLWVPLIATAESGHTGHNAANGHESEGASNADGEHDGSHSGGHGDLHLIDVLTDVEFIGSVVNFAGLIAILIWLGRKPVREFLNTRRKNMEQGLAEAANMKEKAEAKYKEYSNRLAKLDDEIKKLTDTITQTAQNEKDRIGRDADERAARLQQDTTRLIEQQMKQLYSDVLREVIDTSMSTAETVLREKLNSQDQQRLAKDFLEQIAKTSKREGKA